ncbi:AAA family ATPase [Bradyrhizobium sp. Cp5.3]|uniref:AAA family ATPase n=1 Tax=Bradyrhizobium sp. Cp5.3 TaxID=443598 RepID=UPI00040F2518|nr:AAA family ATPase [Bradyrhizobium sp. Cp5.3]
MTTRAQIKRVVRRVVDDGVPPTDGSPVQSPQHAAPRGRADAPEIDEVEQKIAELPISADATEFDEDDDLDDIPFEYRETVGPWWQEPTAIPARESLDRDGHLFRGTVSIDVAGGGKAKTTNSLFEAVQLSAGFDLATKQPLPAGRLRVWVVNGEEDQVELDRRVAAICTHYGLKQSDLGGGLFVQSVRSTPLRLASIVNSKPTVNVMVQRFFVDFMQANAIDVLIVDPLVSFHSLEESNNGQMDLLVKEGFGAIAIGANAACELLHHSGKPRPGLADATVDDGRGASAIIWACRSARVLNFMTPEEAKRLGIAESERRRHIKITNGKANNGPIGGAKWIKLEVEKLPSGDEVAVASSWMPLDHSAGVTTDTMELARKLAATGEYREDSRSPNWFGYAIAPHLNIDVSFRGENEPASMARLNSILKTWFKIRLLSIDERKDKSGKNRNFIVAGSFEPVDVAAAPDEEDGLE